MAKCNVLLIGGIGSGKSTVGRLLQERGAAVFDADVVGHQVLQTDEVKGEIAAEWPSAIRDARVDHKRLASVVFADERQLRRLESITHPRIKAKLAELAASSHCDKVVVEMPVLRDLVFGEWVRVVVDVPDETRLNRLLVRGMDESDARARMRMQPSRHRYIEVADFVIDNNGSEEDLKPQVDELWVALAELCGRRGDEIQSGGPQ